MGSLFHSRAPAAFQEPQALGIDLNSSNYGRPISVVYGQNKVSGNCGWYGDFTVTSQKQGGGKGGGGGVSSYDYHSSYMLVICEGPITGFGNAWQGSSFQPLSNLQPAFTTLGAIGQAAWSHFTGVQALGYSGFALIAFLNNDLGGQASTPNYQFEVNGFDQFGSGITDANPSAIINDICTNVYHGINFPYLGSLTQYSNYCVANGLFLSPVYSEESTAARVLADLLDITNTQGYFSEGQLKLVPYGDIAVTGNGATYTPNLTPAYNFTDSDYLVDSGSPPITLTRKALPDCSNTVRIEYPDRAYYYYDEMVEARDQNDAIQNGVRAMESTNISSITTGTVARFIAQNKLQRELYIRNTYEWQAPWYLAYLEPSDPVTITDTTMGFNQLLVRLTQVEEKEDGSLHFTAEELPVGVGHSENYNTQANGGYTINTQEDPGPVDTPVFFRAPGFIFNQDSPNIGIATSGGGASWGGAQVWISMDGVNYYMKGVINLPARYGLMNLPVWAASTVMAVGQIILDSNGNTQQVFASVSPFKTGLTHPAWAATVGTHTTDNNVTWNCIALGGVAIPSVADPDTTDLVQVTLESGQLLASTNAQADQMQTMFMVDNEIMSYGSANLVSGETYQLGYLRRGTYGSAAATHVNGCTFIRLDDNIFYWPFDSSLVGQTIYVKFLSYNVFGITPRTLAGETAYSYVIGTNTNLPDVPSTPTSFTVTAVPTGLQLNWSNANPAAVGATTIERSPDNLTWTVIGHVHGSGTTYLDPVGNGTFYYRIRARGALTQAGWSAWTAGVQQGVNVALVSSNYPPGQNLVNNGNFEAATFMVNGAPPGWMLPNGAAGLTNPQTVAYETASPYSGNQSLHITCNAVGQGIMLTTPFPVNVGDFYSIQCATKLGVAGQHGNFGINFFNAAGALISGVTQGPQTTAWVLKSIVTGQVPAGAVTAYVYVTCTALISGTADLWFDNCTVIRMANPATGGDVAMRGSVPITVLNNTLNYTAYADEATGVPAWIASHAYGFGQVIKDSNGNIQACIEAGTSLAAHPVWGTSVGTSVTDGASLIWICISLGTLTNGCAVIYGFGVNYLRSDGSSGSMPNFVFYCDNLAINTTYYLYPAITDLTGELLFYTDGTGTGGAGAALYLSPLPGGGSGIDTHQAGNHMFYATKSTATVSLQTQQGLVALSSTGNFSVVVPASGSGGGAGGGPSGNCWHPAQSFDTEGGAIQAMSVSDQHKVWTPSGWVAPTPLKAEPEMEWLEVTYQADSGRVRRETVTPRHCFINASGKLVAAKDLRLGMLLTGSERGYVRVCGLQELVIELVPVKLEMPEPHLLCAYREDGVLSHNPNVKP